MPYRILPRVMSGCQWYWGTASMTRGMYSYQFVMIYDLWPQDLGQCRKALGSSAEGSYVCLGILSWWLTTITTAPSTTESRSPLDSEITFPFNQPATQFQVSHSRGCRNAPPLRLASANIEADEDGWTEDIRNFQKASGWELESCRRSTYSTPKKGGRFS